MTDVKELEHIVRIDGNGVFRHAAVMPELFDAEPMSRQIHETYTARSAKIFVDTIGGKTLTLGYGPEANANQPFGYRLDGSMSTRMWSAVQPMEGSKPSPRFDYRKVPMYDEILAFRGARVKTHTDPRFFLFNVIHNAFAARAMEELNEEAARENSTYLAEPLSGDMHYGSITFVKVTPADANRMLIGGFGFLSANYEDYTHEEQRKFFEEKVERAGKMAVLGNYTLINGYAAGSPYVILGR